MSVRVMVVVGVVLFGLFGQASSQEKASAEGNARIEELERSIKVLSDQLQELKAERAAEKAAAKAKEEAAISSAVPTERINDARIDSGMKKNRLTLGGYGEIHANLGDHEVRDQIDIHRLVLYAGYDVADWIKLHSETEVEHAFVSKESDGELSIEQAYADFLLSDNFNVRAGRFLTPLGLVNRKHEPPAFNGVERPFFERFIIPSTWFSDGIGMFGSITPSLKYEAYVVGGLNGSKFNDMDGIREGRIEESPSLHSPAFTGRLDYYPLVFHDVRFNQSLRLGAGVYFGGLDNSDEESGPKAKGNIAIYAGDFEYSLSKFDFRGAIAFEKISGARQIGNGAAEEVFGWNFEGACHVLPGSWKRDKLARADAVMFLRYDRFDTQYKMPAGIARNPAGNRYAYTAGANFYLTPAFVIKGDYQVVRDNTGTSANLLNFGMGWHF
jgi:hypothetical protein